MEEENAALRQRVEKLESRAENMEEVNKAMKAGIPMAAEKSAKDGIKAPLTEVSQAMTQAAQLAVKEAFQDALKEANPLPREATKGLIEGMDRMTDSMRSVVIAVQGLKRVFRVGLQAVDNNTRAIDHRVCWMLDYYLDENERFHSVKVVLQGLLGLVGSSSPATSTTSHPSWGGDPAKNQIGVDKSGREEYEKAWYISIIVKDCILVSTGLCLVEEQDGTTLLELPFTVHLAVYTHSHSIHLLWNTQFS